MNILIDQTGCIVLDEASFKFQNIVKNKDVVLEDILPEAGAIAQKLPDPFGKAQEKGSFYISVLKNSQLHQVLYP